MAPFLSHFASYTAILGLLLLTLLCGGSEGKIANDHSNGHWFDEPFERCDFFKGNWVFDNSYPLYDSKSCPFIEQKFDCLKNGRPDQAYLKYRWQPKSCDFARFNGGFFLERHRNKRIMFVGDSFGQNQWQSLACMLHNAVPYSNYTLVKKQPLTNLTFPGYNVSILFKWDPYLVELYGNEKGKTLKLDSLKGGESWKGMDVLVFNAYHWFTHKGKDQEWSYMQIGNKTYNNLDRTEAFKTALTTWGRWIDSNIKSLKTQVVFQGVSPVHYNGAYKCNSQSQPLQWSLYPEGSLPEVDVMKRVLRNMTSPVYLLDITLLSQLRVDGHPSVYTSTNHTGMDCSHWCLAGVPDTWNQLLYSTLI